MKLMPKNLNAVFLGAFILLLTLFNNVPAQAAATPNSIAITPSIPTIGVGQTQVFTATGTFFRSPGGYPSLSHILGAPVPAFAAAVTTISKGGDTSCALLASGAVECWGQFGNPNGLPDLYWPLTPVTVSGISTATAIAVAGGHICVLLASGTVQCWGDDAYGELGSTSNNWVSYSYTPISVSGISTATAIAAGSAHSCAVLANGTAQCWGWNARGELGNGTTTDSATPVTVSGINTATAIALGDNSSTSCALLASGAVQCWGSGEYGQLGDGTFNTYSSTPVTVSGISTATAVTVGEAHSCALLAGGTMQCWGDNSYGQLGNGTQTPRNYMNNPPTGIPISVAVSGINTSTAIVAGRSNSCAALADGSVQCWGSNWAGILGDGTAIDSSTPVTVSGIPGAVWSSSDTSVAMIDANGLVTGLSPGTTTITATATDGSVSASAPLTVSLAPTELVVDSLTVSPNPPVAPGQPVTITATVRNKGGFIAFNFAVDLYKHLLTKPGIGQTGDWTCNVPSLASGATTTCTNTVSYAAVGNYKVRAQVDTMNTVTESNEKNNNLKSANVRVRLPDLTISMLTASTTTPTVGQPVTLTATVKLRNVGKGAICSVGVDLYQDLFSAPDAFHAGDVTCRVSDLTSLTATCTGTVFYSAPGTYQAWAQVDRNNEVVESRETNNVKGPLKITVH